MTDRQFGDGSVVEEELRDASSEMTGEDAGSSDSAECTGSPEGETPAGEARGQEDGECPEAAEECGNAEAENAEEADDASDAEAAEGADDQGKGLKKLFGKKKDKRDRQIEDLTGKIAELTDRAKRSLAEFDNYRKRTDREKAAMFDMGERAVIEKILPVVDNFERGLATVPEDRKEDPFVTGMDKIYQQLMKTLEEMGVRPIEALGQPFDPAYHNAVMHIDDENLGENVVAEEFQKGYLHKDTVVRHSMVKVAN